MQPLTAADDIASNTMVRDWLAESENGADLPRFVSYLSGVLEQHKAATAFVISSATSRHYSEKGLERTLSRANAQDAWYYRFLDSAQRRVVEIGTDGNTGALTLFIDLRVEKAGQLLEYLV